MAVGGPYGQVAGVVGDVSPAPVPWEDVVAFRLGTAERPARRWFGRAVRGPLALRVRQGTGRNRVFPPCAFPGPPPAAGAAGGPVAVAAVYADAGRTRPICTVDQPVRLGRERHWMVRDTGGREIGAVREVPGPFRRRPRSWRIEQPGRPEITGRSDWLTWNPLRVVWKLIGGLWGAVMIVFSFALDSGDVELPDDPPKLIWRTGRRTVATSRGSWEFRVRADWLDRRLLFAFTVIDKR
ncbi:hypothetical protein [Streptomyces sp. NPDC002644]